MQIGFPEHTRLVDDVLRADELPGVGPCRRCCCRPPCNTALAATDDHVGFMMLTERCGDMLESAAQELVVGTEPTEHITVCAVEPLVQAVCLSGVPFNDDCVQRRPKSF